MHTVNNILNINKILLRIKTTSLIIAVLFGCKCLYDVCLLKKLLDTSSETFIAMPELLPDEELESTN